VPRVIHFDIHADDIARAKAFYENVFDWKIERWEVSAAYWNITTGKEGEPGINGGLMKRQGGGPRPDTPISGYICTIEVSNLDEYIAKVKKYGGQITMEKRPIRGMGWFAYCLDTERNIFGIMQPDKHAR
jgi:uncharacterized protein